MTGDSLAELNESMKKRRPFEHNAYTQWHINWNYDFLISESGWRLKTFDTRVQIRYTLPQWDQRGRPPQEMVDEWERFMEAVTIHENGHAEIGLKAAAEMQRVISFTTWHAKTRNELKEQIDKKCSKILSKYRELEIKYDKDTDHGKTQGARLRVPSPEKTGG